MFLWPEVTHLLYNWKFFWVIKPEVVGSPGLISKTGPFFHKIAKFGSKLEASYFRIDASYLTFSAFYINIDVFCIYFNVFNMYFDVFNIFINVFYMTFSVFYFNIDTFYLIPDVFYLSVEPLKYFPPLRKYPPECIFITVAVFSRTILRCQFFKRRGFLTLLRA